MRGAARAPTIRGPQHPVAAQAPELVCGMNHAFLRGYLAASGHPETTAVLAPHTGVCCVELRSGPALGEEPPEPPGGISCIRDTHDGRPPTT